MHHFWGHFIISPSFTLSPYSIVNYGMVFGDPYALPFPTPQT